MEVIAHATGSQTFVASNRPPSPTSITANPHPDRAKCRNPRAVPSSKNVAGAAPPASARAAAAATSVTSRTNVGSSGSAPSTVRRSSNRTRCGEVNSPHRTPQAVSPPATHDATVPFPLVPAICTAGTRRCGSSSSASSARTPSRRNASGGIARRS